MDYPVRHPALLIDADACPVKEEACRVAERYRWPVYLVSNSGSFTRGRHDVHSVMVSGAFDAADDWIAERASPLDVVVTADIPLASRALAAGAKVLGPNGREFTESSIGAALAMRELNRHLRETGESKGHNAPFTGADRSQFLQTLDRLCQKIAATLRGGVCE